MNPHRFTPLRTTFERLRAFIGGPLVLALAAVPLGIIPEPRSVVPLSGPHAQPNASWRIQCDPALGAPALARALRRDLRERVPGAWAVDDSARSDVVRLALGPGGDDTSAAFRREGYRLEVLAHGITIEAPSPHGVFNGIQTLLQLLDRAQGRGLAPMGIADRPALEIRGVSEDISRGQMPTLEELRRRIRRLAHFKMNVYLLYMEDCFAFDRDDMGKPTPAGPTLSHAELALLAAEARASYVELIPIFETLGHQDRLLGRSELRHLGESRPSLALRWPWGTPAPGPIRAWNDWRANADSTSRPWSFAPTLPETRRFVSELVDEIARSTFGAIHLGGDEAYDIGSGASRASARRLGSGRTQARYLAALASELRAARGREAWIFADPILEQSEAIEELPPDATIEMWDYDPDGAYGALDTLQSLGARRIVASAGAWNWSAFNPDFRRSFRNVARLGQRAKQLGACGLVVGSWGDAGAECLPSRVWPVYAHAAAAGWQEEAPPDEVTLAAYCTLAYGDAGRDVFEAERAMGWIPWPSFVGATGTFVHRRTEVREPGPERRRFLSDLAARASLASEALGRLSAGDSAAIETQSLRLAARRFAFFADRELTMATIAAAFGATDGRGLPPAECERVAAELRRLGAESAEIEREFERAWRRECRPRGMDPALRRLRAEALRLATLEAGARSGTLAPWRPRFSGGEGASAKN